MSAKNHADMPSNHHAFMLACKQEYKHGIIPAYQQADLILSRRPTRHERRERRENLPACPALFAQKS
jgi:uncharacterized secreted protein with C-terminal beta-propeller domain